jgi:DNA-binding response OmpR family regulator
MKQETTGPEASVYESSLSAQGHRRPCILLAEDDDEMRALLVRTMYAAGYDVCECTDGLELMEKSGGCETETEPARYDLIVSDVRMPWVTGLDAVRILCAKEGSPPVVLITAFGDEKVHSFAGQLGAAAVLDKPFDLDTFIAKVRELAPPESAGRGPRSAGKG